jgi:hypothetical protein
MVRSAGDQRLKPEPLAAQGGTAEAAPFPFLPSLSGKWRNVLALKDRLLLRPHLPLAFGYVSAVVVGMSGEQTENEPA